jgi:hypothetical protein
LTKNDLALLELLALAFVTGGIGITLALHLIAWLG